MRPNLTRSGPAHVTRDQSSYGRNAVLDRRMAIPPRTRTLIRMRRGRIGSLLLEDCSVDTAGNVAGVGSAAEVEAITGDAVAAAIVDGTASVEVGAAVTVGMTMVGLGFDSTVGVGATGAVVEVVLGATDWVGKAGTDVAEGAAVGAVGTAWTINVACIEWWTAQ